MTPTPPQRVPPMETAGESSLFSKYWWLFFNAMRDRVAYLLGLDFVFGGSALKTVGAVPEVTADATLGESTMVDDGTNMVLTDRVLQVQGATQGVVQVLKVGQTYGFAIYSPLDSKLGVYDGTLNVHPIYILNGKVGIGNNVTPAFPLDIIGNVNTTGRYSGSGIDAPLGFAVIQQVGRNTSLGATNLRAIIAPGVALAAGLYVVAVYVTATPTGAATLTPALTYTDSRGLAVSQAIAGITSAVPASNYGTVPVQLDGSTDLQIAIPITGTVTFNYYVAVTRWL